MNKLAQDAIADAKALKEMAVANAQLALEESFRDRVEDIVNEKIDFEISEMEDEEDDEEDMEDEETVDEVNKTSIKEKGTKTESKDGEDLEDDEESEENLDEMDDEDEDEDEEDSLGLDEIIAELEAESAMNEAEDTEDDSEDETEDDSEDDSEDDTEDDDESEKFDIEELLASIGEMEYNFNDKVNETSEISELRQKLQSVSTERDEYKEAVVFMRDKLSEVNLLNAKLLFANKLFQAHAMTNEQKTKIIDALDRTKTVHEVKLVFATLAESIKFASKQSSTRQQSSIIEGLSSKKVGSTAPDESKIISEAKDSNERLRFLAGIIK